MINQGDKVCSELLFNAGAKIINVSTHIEIPPWMDLIIAKRAKVKRTVWALIGVLRKRFALVRGMEHYGNRLPRDLVKIIAIHAWNTRLDHRWATNNESGCSIIM